MRKGKLIMSLALLALIVGFAISATPIVQAADGPIFMEEMVKMRDGVKLYTRIYLPGPGKYPAILTRTPYGIGVPTWYGGAPPGPGDWPYEVFNGYAYVEQDTRGRYYSEGVDRFFYNDGEDGYDTIEWIAKQKWCNAKVGMWGYSAPGITTFLAAGEKPPHLKAIIPASSSGNVMNDLTYDGGAFRGDSLIWGLGQTVQGLSENHLLTVVPPEQQPFIPLHLWNIYQILVNLTTHLLWHNPTLPGWPLFYLNFKATDSYWWMNLPLYDMHPSYAILQPYGNDVVSHPDEDEWRNHYKVYDTVNVPTLLVTGWYDFFPKCQVDAFVDLQSRDVPVKILVGAGTHGNPGVPYLPYYEWFDYWLKGEDTGIMDEPPVLYYSLEELENWQYGVWPGEWRWADQWPPRGVEYTNYYLHDSGDLNTALCAAEEASESYVYDPMDPVLTLGGTNEPGGGAIKAGSFDQTLVVLGRDDILSYASPTLTADVEIAGPLKVVLSASSNCTDTDFTAKLIDVHPSSPPKLMLVADGIIRARYRYSMADPELMTEGDVYEFTIDMGDIAHVFKAGHQIRVDISSSNFPKHDRNLNTGGELYKETEMNVAENTIYHDAENPSYIALPIVSPKPQVFEGYAKIDTKELTYEGPAELHTYKHAVYIHFDDIPGSWIKWEIKNYEQIGDIEVYLCDKGFKVVVWEETYALAKGLGVNFLGSAT